MLTFVKMTPEIPDQYFVELEKAHVHDQQARVSLVSYNQAYETYRRARGLSFSIPTTLLGAGVWREEGQPGIAALLEKYLCLNNEANGYGEAAQAILRAHESARRSEDDA